MSYRLIILTRRFRIKEEVKMNCVKKEREMIPQKTQIDDKCLFWGEIKMECSTLDI